MSETKNQATESGTIPREMYSKYSGVELLRKMIAGEFPQPPIALLLNFALCEADEGRAVFRGVPTLDHYNPAGTVHGGWPATILDSALGCAIQSMLPKGTIFTTIEFKVNLVRPLFEDSGEVTCEGKIIHLGRTTATSEARLVRVDNGKLIAHGAQTGAVIKLGG